MCRDCVAEVLSILEVGIEEARETRPATCAQCAVRFELPTAVKADAEDILCPDCLRGFSTWQGPIDKPATREADLGEQRGPGVRLRKGSGGGKSAKRAALAETDDAGSPSDER